MSAGPLLLAGFVASIAAMAAARRAPRWWLGFSLAAATAGLAAAVTVLAGGGDWDWRPGWRLGGEALHLQLDGVGAFFLALLAGLGGAGTAYSWEYWTDRRHPRSAPAGRAWWSAMLLCMAAVLVSANGIHFLIGWELFTLGAYFLITSERYSPEVRRAGWLYLAASHAAVLCLFVFFATLAHRTGGWELGPMRERADLAPVFWLALVGFGIKAGLFPLHIWLPSAHANAPSHVSAMMSGVAIKMGIFGLVRFTGWLPVPASAGWIIAALGVASAVLGVVFALAQHDLKRLLAYHSVENIGIILIGLGFALVAIQHDAPGWGALALAGGLLHVWNHGIFKALLFLGAGSVVHATHTREMSRLGGLWRGMPWTAACFALGAAAIAGLPPLNGFISEWLVYLGLFDAVGSRSPAVWIAVPAAVLLAMTGALALACFVKVCSVVFLGSPRSDAAAKAHEAGPWMRIPMAGLAAMCVAIGIAPAFFWPAVARAAAAWRPGWFSPELPPALAMLGACNAVFAILAIAAVLLLRGRVRRNGLVRSVTWDCGYARPEARMQYTAGSFAGILTGWFSWILRPAVHRVPPDGILPSGAVCEEHTPETVLEKVVEPAAAAVMAVSVAVRRLQHGRLQAYILYLVLGLIALLILSFAGGNS
ncbi:MAG: proton-conducting transporter membrane subunit [Verrucomicrobiota bacterium]